MNYIKNSNDLKVNYFCVFQHIIKLITEIKFYTILHKKNKTL